MPMSRETTPRVLAGVFLTALAGVVLTRWPVMRVEPIESDDFMLVDIVQTHWFHHSHTLFLTFGRLFGDILGDAYRGFVVLDMLISALGLTAAWWWLRALVRPAPAALATLMLAVAPVFWGYGAKAGSYTMIVAVGSFLLGVAARSRHDPKAWHPYAAAVVLALGTGYRSDIGMLWLPIFLVILWMHRWTRAIGAGVVFTILNLTWLGLMLHETGGLVQYRAQTQEFAHEAGYLNSVWNLGVVDATLRYAFKLTMALLWTFGPGLVFVPRGLYRMARERSDRSLALLLILSMLPALGLHLTVHFGVPGYAFHYVPALLALIALGIGRVPVPAMNDHSPVRLGALAASLAALFLFYPTDYNHPGFRGDFDLSFARNTRLGLRAKLPEHAPAAWRTANSRKIDGRPLSSRPERHV